MNSATSRQQSKQRNVAQRAIPEQSKHHQAAVNSLAELSLTAAGMPGTPSIPFDRVPELFRVEIKEGKAAQRRNEYGLETDLIEHALMLIDRNGGDATIRTPEQEQFYADLLMSLDATGPVRITYAPSNVTVH